MTASLLRLLVALSMALGSWLGYKLGLTSGRAWDWAIALAIVALPLSHAIGLLFGFFIAEMADRDPDNRRGRGDASGLVRAYLTEIYASTKAFCWLQPFFVRKKFPPAQRGTREAPVPVLFLHGYFCNRGMWHPLARHLRDDPVSGQRLMSGISMEPTFGSIDRYVDSIHEQVQRLHKASGRKVAIVSHSMGGLAARAYLRKYRSTLIEGVITLGTPHQGTVLADYGHGTNVKQMRLHSEWLGDLATHERGALMPPFEVILSLHDNIVSPRFIQTIPGANTQIVEGIGHLGLAFNRDIWRLIDKTLAGWDKLPLKNESLA